MSSITAAQVKELRDRTNAAMMECKKALQEANGDIDKAIEIMRKAGQAKAVKKAGRTAAEGTIVVLGSSDGKQAVLIELNCETDFVAREERFKQFAKQLGEQALAKGFKNLEALQEAVETERLELISTLGENIHIRRMSRMDVIGADATVAAYGHGDANGVRIGVMVSLKKGSAALARDLAMHVAAMNPEYVKSSDIPQSRLDQEKEIFIAQVREEGKPEAMAEKIVAGKVNKFSADISLLPQAFVKDPSKSIEALLKENNAEIQSFERFEVGEGIEKKQDNFVAEVMAQVKGTQ